MVSPREINDNSSPPHYNRCFKSLKGLMRRRQKPRKFL